MEGVSVLNLVSDYIEKNIFGRVDVDVLARIAGLSVYEFRRIFSFVAGTPINEYIRKRRLSLAAEKLLGEECDVTTLSSLCGYESTSSFSRAYKDFFGFSPSETLKNSDNIKTFTKLSFSAQVNGGKNVDYRLVKKRAFFVCGIDGMSQANDTECCESVWQKYYSNALSKKIESENGEVFAAYVNGKNSVRCYIGYNAENADTTLSCVEIPESFWAEFSVTGSEDDKVNALYDEIFFNWIKSTGYERRTDFPNVEIFPSDMSAEDFMWRILIPVKRKSENDE